MITVSSRVVSFSNTYISPPKWYQPAIPGVCYPQPQITPTQAMIYPHVRNLRLGIADPGDSGP